MKNPGGGLVNLTQLEYFKMLAEKQHLTKTAETLFVTPPTISASMKSLEDELGVPLFDRVGRDIHLNECGKAFLPHVTLALQSLEDGKRAVSLASGQRQQVLRFSVQDLSMYCDLLREFYLIHPDIVLQPCERDPDDDGDLLWQEHLNLMITAKPLTNKSLSSCVLYDDPIVLSVSPQHPLARKQHCSLAELRDEIFLVRPKAEYFQQYIDHILEEYSIVPRQTRLTSYASRHYMVYQNEGIAITTKVAVANPFCPRNVPLLIDELADRNYSIKAYWRRKAVLTPIEKSFLNMVSDYGKRMQKNIALS